MEFNLSMDEHKTYASAARYRKRDERTVYDLQTGKYFNMKKNVRDNKK